MCSLVCLKAKNERMKETQKMVAFFLSKPKTILPILRSLGLFLKGLFGGLQNYEHTLANFKCYWINFNYCKWQTMEQPDSVTR